MWRTLRQESQKVNCAKHWLCWWSSGWGERWLLFPGRALPLLRKLLSGNPSPSFISEKHLMAHPPRTRGPSGKVEAPYPCRTAKKGQAKGRDPQLSHPQQKERRPRTTWQVTGAHQITAKVPFSKHRASKRYRQVSHKWKNR